MFKRRKLRKSDIFDELKEQKQNPIIPIIIFLSVVTILFLGVYFGYKIIKNNTDVKLPWVNTEEKEKEKPKHSSKPNRDLLIPELPEEFNTHLLDYSELKFTEIKKDSNGYIITVSLMADTVEFITVEFNSMTIDGFYISSKFAISDRMDHLESGEQIPTLAEFRINKTELDNLGIFGFNELRIYFNYETPDSKFLNSTLFLVAVNDINVVNERKGLIQIDKKDDITISYYKTVDAKNATYIYFDIKNQSKNKDVFMKLKKLEINGKPYTIKNFEKKVYRDSEDEMYLKIPKSEISKVSSFNVSFFVLSKDDNSNIDSIYITNEYTKTY